MTSASNGGVPAAWAGKRVMYTGLYANRFAEAFSRLLEETGLSCYKISQYTDIDQGYLSRLKNGEKGNPSPEIIVKISLAFARLSNKIRIYDIEPLFKAVGRSLQSGHQ